MTGDAVGAMVSEARRKTAATDHLDLLAIPQSGQHEIGLAVGLEVRR